MLLFFLTFFKKIVKMFDKLVTFNHQTFILILKLKLLCLPN